MSIRRPALLLASVILITACSDASPTTGPAPTLSKPALAIDAGTVCTGATMPVVECQALVVLYNTTGGPTWTTNDGWGVDPNPCNWSGVECTGGDNGSVRRIVLIERGLAGPMPSQLGNLPNLEVVKLDHNELTGALPASLANLGNLDTLSVWDNALSGPLPAWLGTMTGLSYLSLSDNQFTGTIPAALGNLTNLQWLGVGHNDLTGVIPPELGNLANVSVLLLSYNALTGPIPAALGNLSNLQGFNLSGNQLSGSIPPELGNLAKLNWISADDNLLTGQIPATFGNLDEIENIHLDGNALSGPLPPALADMEQLAHLYLHDNAFTGPLPTFLSQITTIESVTLHGNQFSGVVPLSVAAWGEGAENRCEFVPGNPGLYVPDVPEYRAVDQDGDNTICGIPFSSAEDIGEDALDAVGDLVPDVLNEGQANALETKIENAMAKAAKGQYAAAINQMQAFIVQLNEMVAGGTLTPAQAAPFIQQADWLIALWSGMA
jgi:hypothetical protein